MENQFYIALQNNKLFLDIDLQEMDLSEIKGELKTLKEGEILFREENPADNIFLIVSGEINLLKKKLLGSTKSFIFGENDFFGYDEIAEETSRTSTAVALRDCYLISFSEDEINKLIEQNHMIKTNLLNFSDIEPQDVYKPDESDTDDAAKKEKQIQTSKEKSKKTDVASFEQSLKDDLIDKLDTTIEENAALFEEDLEEPFEKLHTEEKTKTSKEEEKESELEEEPLFPDDEVEKQSEEDYLKLDDESIAAISSQEEELEEKPRKLNDFDEAFFKAFNEANGEKPTEEKSDELDIVEITNIEKDSPEFHEDLTGEVLDEESIDIDLNQGEEILDEEPLKEKSFEEKINEQENQIINRKTSNILLQSEQLKKIIKAAQLVNSNIKIDDVLQNIVNVAIDLTEADRGTLYLIDKERNELWSKVLMGNEMREIRLNMGEGVAGWVAQNRETVNIEDAAKDERFKSDYDKASGYKTHSMLCFPLKNREDEIVGVIQLLNSKNGSFSEMDEEFLSAISIQCSLALQNAEMLERLLQTERVQSLGKMTNFLIQDIKKPVLVSKRYAEHLQSKELNKDAAQIVEMILEQLTQVADLVQTTSSYSEGKAVLRTSRVSLNETLKEFGERLESFVKSRNSTINNKFDKDLKVQIDSKEFFQCYNHIIKNACDAMPDGGSIEISTKQESNNVVISIKDSGLGIPESLLNKLFDPFMTHGKKEGTGLGLTITKKIVESHSGKISVVSNLGEGATFKITLPIASAL